MECSYFHYMERLIRIVVMEQFGLFLINSSFRHIICYNEKYMDECKEIVRNEIPEELSDEMLTIVTNEIMDTCLFIGGDFKKENIIDITKQYVTMGGIRRIKKAHEGI